MAQVATEPVRVIRLSTGCRYVEGMDPIYDPRGKVCGWRRGESLFDVEGSFVGFVHDDCVINRRGRHVGWLESGHFVERHGDVVAWVGDAKGGPPKAPPTVHANMPPVTAAVTGRLVGPQVPRPSRLASAWAAMTWADFLDDAGRGPA